MERTHDHVNQPGPMSAGAEYPVVGWAAFVRDLLVASDTIDARRAARQSAQGKGGEAFAIASDTKQNA